MTRFRRHIVVDMTPLEPRGQNGGAGLVATSLVRHLGRLDPNIRLTLLTADDSHAELASLESDNIARRLVVQRGRTPALARRLVDTVLPPRARLRLKAAYRRTTNARQVSALADQLQTDLLFCPFTTPTFWQAGVPCVSIIYDLQHVTYPEFFGVEQRLNRSRHVREACERSDAVVCISKYVRQTLLSFVNLDAERAVTIPLGLLHEPVPPDFSIVERLGLTPGGFLLYPANFWPHKNHARLFDTLRQSGGHLVCTGAPNALMRELAAAAPDQLITFAGYVDEAQLAGLYQSCAALIFPSLYEGFGLPVLEAMAQGKPVLCSKTTSLPEVAGDAAIYFDPTSVSDIAVAIGSLTNEASVTELVERGRARAASFGTARELAERYLGLFERVLYSRSAAATSRPAS